METPPRLPPESPDKPPAQRLLEGLLWLFGGFGLLAIVPTLMPQGWLAAAVHLAEPGTPVRLLVEYLARSISAMYVLLGGLLCLGATDVRRYAPMLRWMAVFLFVAGLAECLLLVLGPDPKNVVWLLLSVDGGIIALFGLAVWALLQKMEKRSHL